MDAINIVNPDEEYFDWNRTEFTEKLLNTLDTDAFPLNEWQQSFAENPDNQELIYVAKFNQTLFRQLEDRNLAIKFDDDRFLIEKGISRTLMLHLATVVSTKRELELATDQAGYLDPVWGMPAANTESLLRQSIFDGILPYPVNPNWKKLIRFKRQRASELKWFRERIEHECARLMAIEDHDRREYMRMEAITNLSQIRDELSRDLIKSKVGKAVAFGVFSLVSASAMAALFGGFLAPLIGATISPLAKRLFENVHGTQIRANDMMFAALLKNKRL